jgi:hypothetical protein
MLGKEEIPLTLSGYPQPDKVSIASMDFSFAIKSYGVCASFIAKKLEW